MEDGKGVSAPFHSPFIEDDRDKMNTRRLEERGAGSVGEKPDISCRYVADDVRPVVDNSDAGEALVVHERQSFRKRAIRAIQALIIYTPHDV